MKRGWADEAKSEFIFIIFILCIIAGLHPNTATTHTPFVRIAGLLCRPTAGSRDRRACIQRTRAKGYRYSTANAAANEGHQSPILAAGIFFFAFRVSEIGDDTHRSPLSVVIVRSLLFFK